SAVVGPHPDFLRGHASVATEAEPHPVAHRHARVAGEKFLLPRVKKLHRTPRLAGEQCADDRGVVVAGLAAKAATDLGLDHPNLRLGYAERNRIAAARQIGRLRIAPHGYAVTRPL